MCGKVEVDADDPHGVLDPRLIVEVLSTRATARM